MEKLPIRKNKLPLFLRKKMGIGGDFELNGSKADPNTWQTGPSPIVQNPVQGPTMYRIPEENRFPDTPSFAYTGQPDPLKQKTNIDYIDGMYIGNVALKGLAEMNSRANQQQYIQANTANPLANLPFDDGQSEGVKYGYAQFAKGGSLYDYLHDTGRSNSMGYGSTRKALAKQLGIDNYSGTAEQNTKLLSILQEADDRGVSPMNRQISSRSANPTRQMSPAPAIRPQQTAPSQSQVDMSFLSHDPLQKVYQEAQNKEVVQKPQRINTSGFRGIVDSFNNTGYGKQQELQAPQSGVVVDKRTGQAYVTNNGKVVRRFPVLTGLDIESNVNSINVNDADEVKNGKSTPVGYYKMRGSDNLNDVDRAEFEGNAQRMDAISAYGMRPALATGLGVHQTYDPEHRNKLFNTSTPYASFGCINCHKPDIKDIDRRFPQGDTLLVTDSKDPKFSSVLSKLEKKKDGGSIHIKKSHEGKFTEYKKRTGKTTEEALHSKDAHVRKMANFAKNASGWKKQYGGNLRGLTQ